MVENGCKCTFLCWADCGWWASLCTSWPSLHQQPAHPWLPLPRLVETVQGWGGKPRQGCMWLETPCTMSRAARRRRASRGPWMLGIWTRTLALALWSISKGQAAGGTETQELAEVVRGYRSCSALLAGGGPHPRLRSPPPSGPGRHRAGDTGVSDSASDFFFFPQDSTKKRKWEAASFMAEIRSGGLFLACRSPPMLQHRKFASANTWCCFKQPDGPNLSLL